MTLLYRDYVNMDSVNEHIIKLSEAITEKPTLKIKEEEPLFLGIDIGTADVVSIVVNGDGEAIAGEIKRANVVREGMVVDYFGAIQIVKNQIKALETRLEHELTIAVSAVPPGTQSGNGKVTRNILEAVGLNVLDIIDEPSAASRALGMKNGAVVDVGGGTTGISILKNGKVIYTADEATGGFHFDLVIAGGLKISIEEAEKKKCDPDMQKLLFPSVKPVCEKIITIIKRHIQKYSPEALYMVGGTCTFPGFKELMEKELQIPVYRPEVPLLLTPLGIALACRDLSNILSEERREEIG